MRDSAADDRDRQNSTSTAGPDGPHGVIGKDGAVPSFGGPGAGPRRDRPRGAGPDPLAPGTRTRTSGTGAPDVAGPDASAPGTSAPDVAGPDGTTFPYAVRIRDLWKQFGEQIAVGGIDLDVPAGRFVGLVGPNGAGKTTTLSMVTGLLRPDSGSVLIAGHDVWQDPVAVKARIGVLPEGLRLFERLSGRELLTYLGALRGLPEAEVERRGTQLLDVLDLAGAQNKLIVDYSTGMRKKIGLAAALLHNPEVLFLDEPFEGVDPVSAQTIRGVLERYTTSGATVVFSSHVMELVESLCDWVAVLATGKIRAHGPLAEVRGSAPTLHEAFLDLVGATGRTTTQDSLDWLGAAPTGSGTTEPVNGPTDAPADAADATAAGDDRGGAR